jgi:hypothetical protein
VDLTDGIYILNWLFSGGPAPPVKDAADTNDDGVINITDSDYLLDALFNGGPPPPYPYVQDGENLDPTFDQWDPQCTFSVPQVMGTRVQSFNTANTGPIKSAGAQYDWDSVTRRGSSSGPNGGLEYEVEFKNNQDLGNPYACWEEPNNFNCLDIEFGATGGLVLSRQILSTLKSDGTSWIRIYWEASVSMSCSAHESCVACVDVPPGTVEADIQAVRWGWHARPETFPASCDLIFNQIGGGYATFKYYPILDMWNRPGHGYADDYVTDGAIDALFRKLRPLTLEECDEWNGVQAAFHSGMGPLIYGHTSGAYLAYRMCQLGVPADAVFTLSSIKWNNVAASTGWIPCPTYPPGDCFPPGSDWKWVAYEHVYGRFEQLNFVYCFGDQEIPWGFPDDGEQSGLKEGPYFDWSEQWPE